MLHTAMFETATQKSTLYARVLHAFIFMSCGRSYVIVLITLWITYLCLLEWREFVWHRKQTDKFIALLQEI
jgi:hypothetical protein